MRKKLLYMSTVFLLFGLVVSPLFKVVNAQPVLTESEVEKEESASDFMQFTGIVREIETRNGLLTITVENEDNDNIMIFPIDDEVQLFNRTGDNINEDTIKKGAYVDIYYSKYKPMPLIYPATIVPDFIIEGNIEEGTVKLDVFNKDLVSEDNTLKLNIGKQTELLDEAGNKINKSDLTDKNLLVFYTVSTKSIPAQTTPSKVIALDDRKIETNEIEAIVEEDHYMKNDTKMIPLRKVAEQLGYDVSWDQAEKQVTLQKGNRSFLLTIGQTTYGHNKSINQFTIAPELKEREVWKTYVTVDFIEKL